MQPFFYIPVIAIQRAPLDFYAGGFSQPTRRIRKLLRAVDRLGSRANAQIFLRYISLLGGLKRADQTLLSDGHCVSASL